MKIKNTNTQQSSKTLQSKNQIKRAEICRSNPIPFYITVVSITAIFALLVIFLIEKKENLKCINSGLIQKVQEGKVIWTK